MRLLNSCTASLVIGFISTLVVRLLLKSEVYKLWLRKNKKAVLLPVNPKMVVIVRGDIKMSLGKQLAQICHAGVLGYSKSLKSNPAVLNQWIKEGGAVVIAKLSTDGENKLYQIKNKAYKLNVKTGLIRDAGHTQVKSGTATAVSVGPADFEILKTICDGIVELNEDLPIYKSIVDCNMKQKITPRLLNILK